VGDQVRITSAADPRVADYFRLTDVALRRKLETAHGLFIAEGEKVIRRAIQAGYVVRSILVAEDKLATISDVAAAGTAPCYVVSPEVAEQLAGYRVHRGALASLERLPGQSVQDVLAAARNVVVLEDIVDHANVGAVFRSVAALGFDAVLLSPRCADPFYRRAIKVSMGAVFSVPWGRLPDWQSAVGLVKARGFRVLALTPDRRAAPIGTVDVAGRLALLVGSEGAGLSGRWLTAADESVRIPMHNGVDSLNVGSATAIACYLLADRSDAEDCR
jgi:tRNA G18 (ribose-2'-O)-methylase SpoU